MIEIKSLLWALNLEWSGMAFSLLFYPRPWKASQWVKKATLRSNCCLRLLPLIQHPSSFACPAQAGPSDSNRRELKTGENTAFHLISDGIKLLTHIWPSAVPTDQTIWPVQPYQVRILKASTWVWVTPNCIIGLTTILIKERPVIKSWRDSSHPTESCLWWRESEVGRILGSMWWCSV